MLVGRERELRIIENALSRATAMQGGVIVFSGEPGSGKTSLLHYLRSRADSEHFVVLQIGSLPPLVQNRGLALQRVRSELGKVERLGPLQLNANPEVELASSWVQGDLQSTMEAIRKLSSESPLLIAADDIHNLDKTSLKLLGLLAHSFELLPALLAVAYNPSSMIGRVEAGWIVELIAARGQGVELDRLDDLATAQILHELVGFTPDARIVRSVHELTGGNPRYILACGPILTDLERLHLPQGPGIKIPNAVRAALSERLRAISPEAEEIIRISAVFREAFSSRLIGELVALGDVEMRQALTELESAGLIVSLGDDTYRCAHGFTKELLYREMSANERAELHSRIANVLEAQGSKLVVGTALLLCDHLIRSGEARNLERAIFCAEEAAREFATLRRFVESAEMYSTGLAAAEAQAGFDGARLCSMLIALGEVQRQGWQIEAAQETFSKAAKLAQELENNDLLAQIALGLPELEWPLANSMNATALTLAQKALAAHSGADTGQRALLLARVAGELSFLPEQRMNSEQLFSEAVEMGSRGAFADKNLVWRIYRFRDRILRRPQLVEERLNNIEQMTRIAYDTGSDEQLFVSAFTRFCVLCECCDCVASESEIDLMQHAAAMLDRPEYRVVLLYLRAGLASHRGRLDLTQQLCQEARQTAHQNGLGRLAEAYWPCLNIIPLKEQGRLTELASLAEVGFGMQSCSYAARALSCWVAFQLGLNTEANWQLEILAGDKFSDLVEGPYSLVAAALLADVAAALNSLHVAKLYQFLLPFKDRMVIFEPGLSSFGSVSLYLGKLAHAQPNPELAVAHLEQAIACDRRTGGRTWMGYSLQELARALLARNGPGDRKRAMETLSIAEAEAASLNMHDLAKKARELAAGALAYPGPGGAQLGRVNNVTTNSVECPDLEDSPPQRTACLRRAGKGWELVFEGVTLHLKELRGLTLIGHLLSRPNEAINCLELAALGEKGDFESAPVPSPDLGPVLDEEAKSAYRRRVRELHQELDEARSSGKEEAAVKLEEELRFITKEIARAVGLFGRNRKHGSETERARVRVTSSIKFALRKIAEIHPELGSYLYKAIRTGGSSRYTSEPGLRIIQELRSTNEE